MPHNHWFVVLSVLCWITGRHGVARGATRVDWGQLKPYRTGFSYGSGTSGSTVRTHSTEVLAAGTIMHRLVPVRGVLQEARIPQELGTPIYLDSASTVFVASNRAAPKKSAWIRRRSEVLVESFELGEVDPVSIDDIDNFSDPYTKRLAFKRWFRHLHYTHNLMGDAPAREDVAGNKTSKLQ